MNTSEKELRKNQRQKGRAIVLVLILLGMLGTTVVLLSFLFPHYQILYKEFINTNIFYILLFGFAASSLLSMNQLMVKRKAVKKLKEDLVEQKSASQVLKRRLTELQSVLEMIGLINSEMVLSDVLDTISSKALEILGGNQSSLFLYDPQINRLRCVSVSGGKNDDVSTALVEVGKGIAGWVVQHGKALLLDEHLNESQFRDFVKRDKRITSSLCVPLMVRDQPRGVLNITVFNRRKEFTQSDLNLASLFAENAAIAIDRAGLYEKLKKQAKTLKNVIGELKSTQDKFDEQEKLRALGNLASGMSHDFGNILSGILNQTDLLSTGVEKEAIPENAKHHLLKCVSTIEQLAKSGAETAKHIRKFARTYDKNSENDLKEMDINAIVLEAVGITRPKWKDEVEPKGTRIEMETDLGKLSNPVGNHWEIREVLTSMIFNSIDALPEGGKIRIITRMRDNQVEIKVIDNGVGMSEEIRKRVFEPFLTTKKEKGDGMGLSLALGIISRHKGEITVESEPDEGTTFTVTLPSWAQRNAEREREAKITATAT